jgi:hypothetical protein
MDRKRSVGDPPTLILQGYKGGRVALPPLINHGPQKGVWATRPHLILCGYKGGRVALPPLKQATDNEPSTAKGVWATRPH